MRLAELRKLCSPHQRPRLRPPDETSSQGHNRILTLTVTDNKACGGAKQNKSSASQARTVMRWQAIGAMRWHLAGPAAMLWHPPGDHLSAQLILRVPVFEQWRVVANSSQTFLGPASNLSSAACRTAVTGTQTLSARRLTTTVFASLLLCRHSICLAAVAGSAPPCGPSR